MDSSVLSTAVMYIQNDHHNSGILSIVEDNKVIMAVTYVNLINVDATKRCGLDENGDQGVHKGTDGERDRDSSNVAKLECSGQVYMCGNCKMALKPKEESDLQKQLNIQRIQHQIELEALEHERRMKHLRTLLLS